MAFGDTGFGNDTAVGQRGRGPRGGVNLNRVRSRNRPNNRNRNRNQGGNRNNQNPYDDTVVDPTDPTLGGTGSIFDDEAAIDSAGDTDAYRNSAWGLLNQAGIGQDPAFGGNASDWLDQRIEDWYSGYQGQLRTMGSDALDWPDYLYGELPGLEQGTMADQYPTASPEWLATKGQAPSMMPANAARVRQALAAMFQSQTPRTRGYDSRQYVLPKRTITF